MKARLLLLAHVSGDEETTSGPLLACAGVAAQVEGDPGLSRRVSVAFEVVTLGPAVRPEAARRLGRSLAGTPPAFVVVASEEWHTGPFRAFLRGLEEKAPRAVLGLFDPHSQHDPETAFETCPEIDLLFHAPPERTVPSWLSIRAPGRTGPRPAGGVSLRGDASLPTPPGQEGGSASWRSPYTARTMRVLRGAGLPFILEHYREREPSLAGSPEAFARQFDLAPASRIRADLRTAQAWAAPSIALRGWVVNPEESHARTLARAFRRHAGNATIPFARWLPHGPHTPEVVELLRRVERLEVDYPSSSAEAARFFRPGCGHDAVVSTLGWLRSRSIEPSVCVWAGVPGDDQDSHIETLRRVYALRPSRVNLRGLLAPPGSFLYGQKEKLGLVVDPFPPHHVLGHEGANPFLCRWILEVCRKSANGYNLWTWHARRTDSAR